MKSLILHSDELRSLLDTGRCEVRRRVRPQPIVVDHDPRGARPGQLFIAPDLLPTKPGPQWCFVLCENRGTYRYMGKQAFVSDFSPLGSPGEVRWVRETWADVNTEEGPSICYKADGAVRTWHEFSASFGPDYGAGPSMDYESYPGNYTMWWTDLLHGEPGHSWRSASTMPRWASRLTVRVVSVSVERVENEWWWVGTMEKAE